MAGGPGRPRDASRDALILDAAVHMLLDVGYDRLSIDGVAARAGVGKTTIYRRYPSKAALVTAAVDGRINATPFPTGAGAGNLRSVLLEAAGWLCHEMSARGPALLNAMFAGMRHDPALAVSMRQTLQRDTEELVDLLSAPGSDGLAPVSRHAAALIAEVAPAMIVRQLTVVGEPCDAAFLDHLVDEVLVPLVKRSPTSPTPS